MDVKATTQLQGKEMPDTGGISGNDNDSKVVDENSRNNCDQSDSGFRTSSSRESKTKDCVLVPVPPQPQSRKNDAVLQLQPQQHAKSNFIVQYFKKKKYFKNWNRDQFLTILILSFVEFFASTVVSIQAPFYPEVARKKGAQATEYGLVFGIFEITVFLISPFYGSKMSYLGPTRVFNCGILVTGVCCIIFGLLDQIEGRAPFIWTCMVVRVVEAMGDAAFETASFTIIAACFPNSVGQNFAILEICYGLGMIIGPTLGGALYQLGGYQLPFMTMGGLLFLSAIATYFFLPEPDSMRKARCKGKSNLPELSSSTASASSSEESSNNTPVVLGGFQMFYLLRIPVIAITSFSIVASCYGVGFLSANFELHLEQFHLNKLQVGLVFILNGGVYAVTAPAWGWICDHTDSQKLITLFGAVFTILGFILIGPVPYFPYDTTLAMSCVGLALFGFGLAATLVSAFLQLLNDAINHDYPDDVSTYGLVSGLWTSMAALGYFIGPSLGGVFDDHVGFRWSSVIVIGGQIILILMLCAYFAINGWGSKKSFQLNIQDRDEFSRAGDWVVRNSLKKSIRPPVDFTKNTEAPEQDLNQNGLKFNAPELLA